MPHTSPPTVLLLTSDLATSSKVAGAAKCQGVKLEVAMDASALAAKVAELSPELVILDLSTPRLDVSGTISAVRANSSRRPTIVAFGPHVHEGLLGAAREAGCDRVVSRGQFHAQVDELLSASSPPADE